MPLWIAVAALGILSYSGYLGGHLVYCDGIGVGRHRRETPLPDHTLSVSRTGSALEPVADAAQLSAGGTLRVDAAGTIIAVARNQGGVCASQEFCTHRFGPLSEGAVRGDEVICPWHQSRFNMRTGHVTRGPAKADLRVFKTEIRAGRVCVEVPPKPHA